MEEKRNKRQEKIKYITPRLFVKKEGRLREMKNWLVRGVVIITKNDYSWFNE
ncbi:hypothetical protein [Holospora curviuscula]|uniref:hypothetical protein n=1 Tax=Holospora curviuscula TaxID=1082868 RepID=UPI001A9C50EA|nr:hypothetical protein [Holospora curviuscula]